MIDRNTLKTVEKVKKLGDVYRRYLYTVQAALPCEISEIPAPPDDPESREKFRTAFPADGWRAAADGERWGGDFCYAWFRSEYTVPAALEGKKLLLRSKLGEAEGLLFLGGKPAGLFDYNPEILGCAPRLHEVQPLTGSAKAGERFEIAVECYAGQTLYGTMPYEDIQYNENRFYPANTHRCAHGLEVLTADDAVAEFLLQLRILTQIFDTFPADGKQYAEAANAFCGVFALLPQHPWEEAADWHPAMVQATEVIKRVTGQRSAEGGQTGYVGIIGHSHLDTAWQWPVRETLHKAARTFSNALRLMEQYPDYHFLQSSVLYISWMKKYYPDIYEGIRKRTAEGRWEPNGGAWVECDNNITGGEYIIRQFLRGQRFLAENLRYRADCFWQPDTFGYTAALPQILKGCGIRYFLTTKLSWNESNKFPHDSFLWRGIDGTEVLTHFNLSHCPVDVETARLAIDSVCHKDVTDMKLLAYGYGDGGGGPSYSMQEMAERVAGLPGLPEIEPTTISAFMHRLESTAKNLPVFSGELYLELHRGTLTQMHDIKRSNRMLERAIRDLEIVGHLTGTPKAAGLDDALDTLLLNEFHDILPGTCIEDAHKVAVFQNYRAAAALRAEITRLLDRPGDGLTLCNTLSWPRDAQITTDDRGETPAGCVVQRYTAADGTQKLIFRGVTLAPLSLTHLPSGAPAAAKSPFTVDGDRISTPFADILFADGVIRSYRTKDGFEVVRDAGRPLNTLWFGEDIPSIWDNWDIDYDQKLKMQPVAETVSCTVVSNGPLQLRIRVEKRFGSASSIVQDIVFHADTPRIDFESTVDWNDPHRLLKAGFDVNVQAQTARFETQFGNIKRPTHENYGTDKSQFEVCNHKWSDLSDNRFGVALLNDCKYGISVSGSEMRLTLHKGGCRPDTRGDRGRHSFTYSLLVHDSAFSTESVIRPAYELNFPVLCVPGNAPADGQSLFTLDAGNVIAETVKYAEDGNGMIVRLYETEGSHARCTLNVRENISAVSETNMLEEEAAALPLSGRLVPLCFRPFEIKTLRLK